MESQVHWNSWMPTSLFGPVPSKLVVVLHPVNSSVAATSTAIRRMVAPLHCKRLHRP
jgi:hypothetical protein